MPVTETEGKKDVRRLNLMLVTIAGLVLAESSAMALSLVEQNVVELLRESDAIVVGTVSTVTDGINDKGIPYTEITLSISESIRGTLKDTYTFRQFGLMKPRPTADGAMIRMPAPDGFPRFAKGEHVLLFLYPQAERTGLRTTAGLTQGKFTFGPGFVANGTGNAGLFRNVSLDQALLADSDRRLLATQSGSLSPDDFLGFVRRAVHGRWVETGLLSSRGRSGR